MHFACCNFWVLRWLTKTAKEVTKVTNKVPHYYVVEVGTVPPMWLLVVHLLIVRLAAQQQRKESRGWFEVCAPLCAKFVHLFVCAKFVYLHGRVLR